MTDEGIRIRRPLQHETFGEGAGRTSVNVDVVIRDNGDLVLEGQDLGAAPREIFGDSDYEYWLTIRSEDRNRVLEALLAETGGKTDNPSGERDVLVLDLLVARFGKSDTPLSELKEWLEARGIPFAFNSHA